MLTRLQCDKFITYGFKSNTIEFKDGLNAIIGDSEESKTLFLMILDFVFGGNDFVKEYKDFIRQIGIHSINFSFSFDGSDYHFLRMTRYPDCVFECDSNYKPLNGDNPINLDTYNSFLAVKYGINTDGLTWRDAISKYIRVDKRYAVDSTKPLKNKDKESSKNSIKAYLQQFGKYSIINNAIKSADEAKELFNSFEKALSQGLVLKAETKDEYNNNLQIIDNLDDEIQDLIKRANRNLTNYSYLKDERYSDLNEKYFNCQRKIKQIRKQISLLNPGYTGDGDAFKRNIDQLKRFFPLEEFKEIKNIEHFHYGLHKILSSEFSEERNNLYYCLDMLQQESKSIEEELNNLKNNATTFDLIFKKYSELNNEKAKLIDLNGNFDKFNDFKNKANDLEKEKDETIKSKLEKISSIINIGMHRIVACDMKQCNITSPRITLESIADYSFDTHSNNDENKQLRALIIFDLANMIESTIPFVIHDSELTSSINHNQLTSFIEEYDSVGKWGKQVFASFKSLDNYDDEIQDELKSCKVIEV